MLRKATLEVRFGENIVENFPFEMDLIEKMECFRILRFGEKKATGFVRVEMKPGRHPSEISKNEAFLKFEVLNKKENEYLCIVRKNFSKIFKEWIGTPNIFSEQVDDNLFFDPPIIFDSEKSQFSVVGTQESIDGYLNILEKFDIQYNLKSIKDHEEFEKTKNTNLTDRQEEIISTAYDLGYYDTPKKISSEKLADIFEISQPTLLEHLRKSEKKIMKHTFE